MEDEVLLLVCSGNIWGILLIKQPSEPFSVFHTALLKTDWWFLNLAMELYSLLFFSRGDKILDRNNLKKVKVYFGP